MKKLSLFVYSGLGIFTICFLFLCCKPIEKPKTVIVNKKEQLIPNTLKWSERMALSIMKRDPKAWQIDNNVAPKWDYKLGLVLTSFEKLYKKTGKPVYEDYIKDYANTLIDSSGSIKGYKLEDYNIDWVNPGRIFFDLYKTTKDIRYLKAMQLLRKQLEGHPRTLSGGFWHKKIYPYQMWLDGLYMGEPFYARYTVEFEKGSKLNDVAHQFELLHDHAMDKKTGLFFHAWDESKKMPWANKETGTAPHIWLRALGWYAMALVDVLDYFPKDHPKQKELVAYLDQIANAAIKYQDKSGLWYQVPDMATSKGNYLEASGSAMFAYAFAKGANKGYLPVRFKQIANKAFDGLTRELVKVDEDGEIHITQVCASAGLGGDPYRDGSYEYYINEKIKVDNSHGLGPFILAALELDK